MIVSQKRCLLITYASACALILLDQFTRFRRCESYVYYIWDRNIRLAQLPTYLQNYFAHKSFCLSCVRVCCTYSNEVLLTSSVIQKRELAERRNNPDLGDSRPGSAGSTAAVVNLDPSGVDFQPGHGLAHTMTDEQASHLS